MFYKKSVLKNFTKFTGKHLYQKLLFNKAADLRLVTLLRKESLVQVFPCEFCEIFKSNIFYGTPPMTARYSLSKLDILELFLGCTGRYNKNLDFPSNKIYRCLLSTI